MPATGSPAPLRQLLHRALRGKVLIIGVGNALRGDDGAGLTVASRLQGQEGAVVIEAGASPESFLGPAAREKPDTVLVLDAVSFGGKPGQVRLFPPRRVTTARLGTHGMSIRLLLETLRAEGASRTLLLGIQPGRMSVGQGLSAEVQAAADGVASLLAAVLGGRA